MTFEECKESLEYIRDHPSTDDPMVIAHGVAIMNTALKAIDKQIKKKPNRKEFFNRCPVCGKNFSWVVLKDELIKDDYCVECGQAIDWSEEEEE